VSMKYDVIITGSGPAGTTAANILSRKGFKVLILEKSSFPRKKICAGGLTPKTVKLLDEIGIISENELFADAGNVKKIKGVKVVVDNIGYSGDFEGKSGACINRNVFDNLLKEKAIESGATLLENASAFEPLIERNRVCGLKYKNTGTENEQILEVRAKLVIIAEGAASPLTRKLSKFKSSHLIRAVNAVCKPEPGRLSDYFDFYFDKNILPGYFWCFPFRAGEDYASAGFGVEKQLDLKKEYYNLHNKYIPNIPIIEPPASWIIPCDYPKKIFGDGWLLTGDAAGLANPITGEGIYYAIKSGEFAAGVTAKSLSSGDTGVNVLKEYKILIDDRFKKEYNLSRVIKKLLPLGFHKYFFLAAMKKKGTLEKFMTGEMDFNKISIGKLLKYLFLAPFLILMLSGCAGGPALVEAKKPEFPPFQSYLHYSKGLMLSNQRLYADAIEEFQTSLALDPASEYLKEVLAREYAKAGKLEEAAKLYNNISKSSTETQALLQAAAFYLEQDNLQEAEEICKKIIINEPKSADGYFYLGNIYYKQDKTDKAIVMFSKVIEIDPAADTAYFNLGLAFGKKEDFQNAEKYYRKAAEVNPEYTSPVFALGLMFQIQGKPEKALEEYSKLIEHSKFDPRAFKNIALAYSQLKKYKEAIEALKIAVELDPGDLDSLHRLALILYQEKDYQESIKYAKFIVAADAGSAGAYQIIGTASLELGRIPEALVAYEKFVELEPGNPSGYLYLSYLYTKKPDFEKLILLLEKGVKEIPDNLDLKIYLGGAYFENKNYEKSETAYREALKLKKDDERTLYSLGVLLERKGKYEEAVSSFKNVIALNPKNAEAYNYAGYIYADRNQNLEEAHRLITEALKLEPENGAYVDSLGWVYYRMGRIEEARVEIERAVALMKKTGNEDAIIFEHLAEIFIKQNMTGKAVKMYEKSLKISDNESVRKKLNEIIKTKTNR